MSRTKCPVTRDRKFIDGESAEQFGLGVPLAKMSGEVIIHHRCSPIADVISYVCNGAPEWRLNIETESYAKLAQKCDPVVCFVFLEAWVLEKTLPFRSRYPRKQMKRIGIDSGRIHRGGEYSLLKSGSRVACV